jgi:hypothetical protein
MLAALDVPKILDHVLGYLADDNAPPTLVAASLVSRAWSRMAVAHLWRDGPADMLVRLFTVSHEHHAHYAALLHSLTLKLQHTDTLAYVHIEGVTFPQLRALAVEFTLQYSAHHDHGVHQFIEHAVWDRCGAGSSPLTSLSMSCFCNTGLGRPTLTAESFALLEACCPRLTSLLLNGIFVGRGILQGVTIECWRPDAFAEGGCYGCRSQQYYPCLQRLTRRILAAAAPALAGLLPPTLNALNFQIGPHVRPSAVTILGGPIKDGADSRSMGHGKRNRTAASHIAEAVARRTPNMRMLQVQWCHGSIPFAAWSAFERLLPRLAGQCLSNSSMCSTSHRSTVGAPEFTDASLEQLLACQPLLQQLTLALTAAPLSPAALEVVGRSYRLLEQLKMAEKLIFTESIGYMAPAGQHARMRRDSRVKLSMTRILTSTAQRCYQS